MKIVDSALEYRRAGFSVIPMSFKDKRPLVAWTEFQRRLPDESEIRGWWGKTPHAMCGIVTGELSGCAVVDCDSPEACARIDASLPEAFETPIAATPRGGRHYYLKHPEGMQTKTAVMDKVDIRANGGVIVAPPSINAQGKQYLWLDGLTFCRDTLPEMPETLIETLSHAAGQCVPSKAHIYNNKNTLYRGCVDTFVDTAPLFSEGRRDTDLFTLANSLVKSGMPEHKVREYLEFIVHSWGEHDGTWVNIKIQSALKRQNDRDKTLSDEIREYVSSTSGVFLSTRVHKKNCSEVLRRLISEGVIERFGNKDGCFRKIERDFTGINLLDAVVEPLCIQYPFGIHEKVHTLPKSVAVIAGQTDAGKSAFCLNFAYLNKDLNRIRYLTSEMGEAEIKSRVSLMGEPLESWLPIEFVERASRFADLVLPDGITIIDYMEKADNFFEIAKDIKEVFDRLKTGFALIALQKKAGQDFGRGGDFSAEKARLYLSMSPGTLKIVKAKNWTDPTQNPNGLSMDFKLVKGIKFLPVSGWKRE